MTALRTYHGPAITLEQGVILSAFTGIGCAPFPAIQRYAERMLGRRVMTHEFADPEVWAELKERCEADFRAVCGAPER